MPSGKVCRRRLDDADQIVKRGRVILVVGDAEEQGRQDLMQGSEVIILGAAEDGQKLCGRVGDSLHSCLEMTSETAFFGIIVRRWVTSSRISFVAGSILSL